MAEKTANGLPVRNPGASGSTNPPAEPKPQVQMVWAPEQKPSQKK